MQNKRRYPIDKIPMSRRHMSFWDMFATWIGANANNGTWYIGGVIAACGLLSATKILVISSILSYLLLSLVGFMGYVTGISTTSLTRGAFGVRGSYVPSFINFIEFIGWTAVNTFIAATSLSIIFHDLFGWVSYNIDSNTGFFGVSIGIFVMSVLHLLSISVGERSIRLIERIGIIFVIIFVVWESIVVFRTTSFHELLNWVAPHNSKLSSGKAMDILAAFNLSWVTAGADFTRFTKSKFSATLAPFLGAVIGMIWFALIGIVSTLSVAISSGRFNPNNSDPSIIANKLGLGILAMIVIVLTSVTANAANLMAAASAMNNVFHKIKLNYSLWFVTIISTVITFIPLILGSFLNTFEDFLNYLSMFLGPMISIMVTDFYMVRNKNYNVHKLTLNTHKYWYFHGFNLVAFIIWIFSILIYNYLSEMSFIQNTIGATFLVMVMSSIVYYVLQKTIEKVSNENI